MFSQAPVLSYNTATKFPQQTKQEAFVYDSVNLICSWLTEILNRSYFILSTRALFLIYNHLAGISGYNICYADQEFLCVFVTGFVFIMLASAICTVSTAEWNAFVRWLPTLVLMKAFHKSVLC